MNKKEQRKAAEAFAKRWQGRGYEGVNDAKSAYQEITTNYKNLL